MDKNEIKAFIAKRCAKELKDGDVVNLGIGLPTMIPGFLPEGVDLVIHAVIYYIIKILGELVLIWRIRKISQIEDILDIHLCTGTFFDTLLVFIEKLYNA